MLNAVNDAVSALVVTAAADSPISSRLEASPGISTQSVESTQAALSRLTDRSFDCLVSEHDTIARDGNGSLESIREAHPDLPCILVTRGDTTVATEPVVEHGVTACVTCEDDAAGELAGHVRAAVGASAARRERRQTAARFETVLETMSAAVFLKDRDSRYLLMNDACRELLGVDPDESVVGLTDEDLFDADAAAAYRADDRRVLDTGDVVETREQVETVHGTQTRLTRKRPVYDERGANGNGANGNGAIEAICGVSTDLTAQMDREYRLDVFERAVEQAGHAIYWTDPDGKIEYANPAFETITGYTESEALGSDPGDLLGSGTHEASTYETLWETISAGETWEGELRNERKNGEQYVAKQTIAPVTDETGERGHFVVIQTDVTARRRNKAHLERFSDALQQLQQTTQTLLEATTVEDAVEVVLDSLESVFAFDIAGIWLVTDDGTRLEPVVTTAQSSELFGSHPTYTAAEPSLSWTAFTEGESTYVPDLSTADDPMNPDTPLGSELIVPIADHGVLNVGSMTADAFDEQERLLVELWAETVASALARIEQIQRLVRRKAELREERDRLDTFASTFRHELRNPLNILDGYLQLAQEGSDPQALDRCRNAADRMERLLEDALVILEDDPIEVKKSAVELTGACEAAWAFIRTREATLRCSLPDGYAVVADDVRLAQLIENVLQNAVEHGGHDVTVRVGTLSAGFYIEDDGPGIPPAHRDRVFEESYTTTNEGSGLGLAVVDAVADAHGWTVTLEESVSGGTRVAVRGVETNTH